MERDRAVDIVESVLDRVDGETMPVPVRELWVFGELALGLDPLDRLDLYLTKDILIDGSPEEARRKKERFDVDGIGTVVKAEWAERHTEHLRTNPNGYVAPEKCLAAQLLPTDEPVHLEVCNSGFESNVKQRLEGALARGDYTQILDPRAVCLWMNGARSDDALDKLRTGAYVFPTLEEALAMLGLDTDQATDAATTLMTWHQDLEGPSVRGDIV